MRYLFVATGVVLPWLTGRLTPTLRGRVVAVTQMVTLAIILVIPQPVAWIAAATALALLIWSFAIDVGRSVSRRVRVSSARIRSSATESAARTNQPSSAASEFIGRMD